MAGNSLGKQFKHPNPPRDTVKLSEQEIERAKAGHLPTLDAVASYNDTYANASQYGFGSNLKNGTIGLQLQIPLYQGGVVNSRIRQSVLNKQKALDDLEFSRRQTELENSVPI
ncbi:MAG: TolC family protein [Methyloglobulus sp.]